MRGSDGVCFFWGFTVGMSKGAADEPKDVEIHIHFPDAAA